MRQFLKGQWPPQKPEPNNSGRPPKGMPPIYPK